MKRPLPLTLAVALAVALLAALVVVAVRPGGTPAARPRATSAAGRPAALSADPAAGPVAARPVLPAPVTAPLPTALAADLARPVATTSALRGVAGLVVAGGAGPALWGRGANRLVPPASTLKLATGVAALAALGPTARLTTRVVAAGPRRIVLVGVGDPTLGSPEWVRRHPGAASLDLLAARAARALRGRGVDRVTLGLDATRYRGPTAGPGWKPGYLGEGDVAPVTALKVDEGRVRPAGRARVADPVGAAGRAFAALLARHGVRVVGLPRTAHVPAGAPALAAVASPPVPTLVEGMLTASDNDLAEALAREVAGRYRLPRSFAGGAAGVRRALLAVGIDPGAARIVDGSGLSTLDRVTPRLLVALLRAGVRQPALRPVLVGLPVAGVTGTLADRYRAGAGRGAAGRVRAKTGTLATVSALAGVVVDRDRALLVFAFVAPGAGRTAAEAGLDRLAAVLAGCGCR